MKKILASMWIGGGLAALVLFLAITFGVHAQTFGSPTLVISAYNYLGITGDATTLVKTGSGVLHTITFNAPTATEVVTIYDALSATSTKIATITIPASPMPVTLTYDIGFNVGLTIVTATASSDITIAYY